MRLDEASEEPCMAHPLRRDDNDEGSVRPILS